MRIPQVITEPSDPPHEDERGNKGRSATFLAKVKPAAGHRAPNPRRKWSKKLVEAWKKAIVVDEREVLAFLPTSIEISIAEAFLDGAWSYETVLAYVGKHHRPRVLEVFRSPVAIAWVSRQIATQVQNRLGLVDAALYRRAVGGDTAAMRLFYERFDKLSQHINVNHRHTVDYGAMPDADLRRLAAARFRELQARVIDAGPVDRPATTDGRGEQPPRRGPIALLPAPPESANLPQPSLEEAPISS